MGAPEWCKERSVGAGQEFEEVGDRSENYHRCERETSPEPSQVDPEHAQESPEEAGYDHPTANESQRPYHGVPLGILHADIAGCVEFVAASSGLVPEDVPPTVGVVGEKARSLRRACCRRGGELRDDEAHQEQQGSPTCDLII